MSTLYLVERYEDVRNVVEKEISRLLRCDPHRRPAFVESQAFWAFKSGILDLMDGFCAPRTRKRCLLPQGLVAEAFLHDSVKHQVAVMFSWRDASLPDGSICEVGGRTLKKRKMIGQ
jgi:hypothetical protein